MWQRKGTPWFYTTIDGKQIRLSKDKKEAERMLHAILAQPDEEPVEEISACPSYRKIVDLFLDEAQREKGEETYRVQKRILQSFLDTLRKGIRIVDLKPLHVSQWFQKHPTWGGSYRTHCRKIVKASINWAATQGYISRGHPITLMPTGKYDRRERILTAEERQKIREDVRGDFADFLYALEQTGARPFSEIGKVTAADANLAEGTLTLSEWKNKKKTGVSRVIYMTPGLKSLIERLMARYPEGALFRNRFGAPWRRDTVAVNLTRLAKRLGIPQITAYTFRHAYIVDALERGVSSDAVAELCGTSVKTIAKYYNHLSQKRDFLRDAALRAVNGHAAIPPRQQE